VNPYFILIFIQDLQLNDDSEDDGEQKMTDSLNADSHGDVANEEQKAVSLLVMLCCRKRRKELFIRF